MEGHNNISLPENLSSALSTKSDTNRAVQPRKIGPSLKKYLFGIAYPGFHLVGRSAFFFLNIYYLHMDGNGKKKKKKNLRFGQNNF